MYLGGGPSDILQNVTEIGIILLIIINMVNDGVLVALRYLMFRLCDVAERD
jgi:hypothetical protein